MKDHEVSHGLLPTTQEKSLRGEFASKIFNGSKGYEYRRTIFRRNDVGVVAVYASHLIMKVIGEFEIEDILCEGPLVLWQKTADKAGITFEEFLKYFANRKRGYAIKVGKVRTYSPPVTLTELVVSTAPQSFMYL